jgi:phosphoribosyl 1,2-cyclic phosphate phosphodiesterase
MPAMEIEFLGTGTSQGVPMVACTCAVCGSSDPRDKRLRSSALVRCATPAGEERTLLIDAGPDLRQQMLRAQVQRLHAVLLTHEHMDHLAGIDDLRAFNFAQGRSMDIHGDASTLRAVRRVFHYAFAEDRYPGVPDLQLHTLQAGVPAVVAGVPVLPVEVMHYRMSVLAFRIGGLAYVTDAKSIAPDQREALRGADVLVLNALRITPHLAHFNLEEAVAMVQELAPRRAYLTHISHLLGRYGDVQAQLPPGVELAYDGLRVAVG